MDDYEDGEGGGDLSPGGGPVGPPCRARPFFTRAVDDGGNLREGPSDGNNELYSLTSDGEQQDGVTAAVENNPSFNAREFRSMQRLEDYAYAVRLKEIIVARNDDLVQARDMIIRGASMKSNKK